MTSLIFTTLIAVSAVLLGVVFFAAIPKLRKKRKVISEKRYSILSISVPRENEKPALAAEQVFSALHGIHKDEKELAKSGDVQEWFSFEIVGRDQNVEFYIFTPEELKDFVEGQIYAQYPNVEIREIEQDYSSTSIEGLESASTELVLSKEDVFPIKTFPDFEVDPLAGITQTLSKTHGVDQIWVQFLVKPVGDKWQEKGIKYVSAVREGKKTGRPALINLDELGSGFAAFLKDLITAATNPEAFATASESKTPEEKKALPGPIEAGLTGIDEKITKLGHQTSIRIISFGETSHIAKIKLANVVAAFKQYNTINLNGFISKKIKENDKNALELYQARMFSDDSFILNTQELASIYHFPNISVKTPHIAWSGSKTGEPPRNLPTPANTPANELTVFARADFRGFETEFGIKSDDRRRHIYTIGRTGTGKTTMLENMVVSDIREGKGVAVVDPHGDLVDRLMDYIPVERQDDVVIFDPSDRDYPVGFNLLESVQPELKSIVASGLVGIFKKIWVDSWGPRLEYILRNTILALLDYPNATIIGVLKMFADSNFKARVIEKIEDPVIREFWEKEFSAYDDKFRTEAIAPIQNKVGQFLSSTIMRNILGQGKSSFTMEEIMDKKKIFLVNLSKGKIGEDNSSLLGAMIVTKIQLTAMMRAYRPESERTDFYLYVDEFQNFATESFATILSEARKYKLNLIVANQYISQMPEVVREAVFGNVGTIITFRVGASDSEFLTREFAPVFDDQDLVNLDKYKIYIKMAIDGVTSPAFSALTLPPFATNFDSREVIVNKSRTKYSKPRVQVEEAIIKWNEEESKPPASLLRSLAQDEIKKTKDIEVHKEKSKVFFEVGKRNFRRFKDSSKQDWFFEVPPREQLQEQTKDQITVPEKANATQPTVDQTVTSPVPLDQGESQDRPQEEKPKEESKPSVLVSYLKEMEEKSKDQAISPQIQISNVAEIKPPEKPQNLNTEKSSSVEKNQENNSANLESNENFDVILENNTQNNQNNPSSNQETQNTKIIEPDQTIKFDRPNDR